MMPPPVERSILIQWMLGHGYEADPDASFTELLNQLALQIRQNDDQPWYTKSGENWHGSEYPIDDPNAQGESWRNS
jgi:hypothetical protein